MGGLREECGVFGIYSAGEDVASACYYGLNALQHRGQMSCGIVVRGEDCFHSHKGAGLVIDVFDRESIERLGRGDMAIGHVLYGRDRDMDPVANAQPLVVTQLRGTMALASNGCLTNAYPLRHELERRGCIFHTPCDAEVIAYLVTLERLESDRLDQAILLASYKIEGAYSLLVMAPDALYAMRDPLGFRPLCIGKKGDGSYIVASESCALDSVGAEFVRDVEPGELVTISAEGIRSNRERVIEESKRAMCAFEFIYFTRPDSVVDGSPVNKARQRAGAFLSLEHPVQADVVIGVPDSGLDAAIGYARQSGIPYEIGFIKSRYIGRTFIEPEQAHRQDMVLIKLNAIRSAVSGKRVIVIEDSIVRGTTSTRTVRLLREAGAKEVHMRVASPPFVGPCHYGTDVDSPDHLIASRHTVEEIARLIGVNSLGYLSIEHVRMLAEFTRYGFCDACFTKNYPVARKTAAIG